MSMDRRVVVAGAGVTGLTAALALARAGLAVTVCDPAPLGENASGVAAGMLAPAFEAALDPAALAHFPLLKAGRDRWPAVAETVGIELDRVRTTAVGHPEWLAQVRGTLETLGVAVGQSGNALTVTEDWRIEPPAAMAALRGACGALGVVFLGQAVARFALGEAVLADGAVLAADRLVAATGFATDLAPELAVLKPIKGHILRLPPTLGGGASRYEGFYLCAGRGGMLVGATMEAGRSDTAVDPVQVAGLMEKARRIMPALQQDGEPLVGVRAATPDGLPLVGPSSAPGVIVAAGMRRNGWLLAPLVADLVAAYALGQDPGPWAKALAAGRFDESRG